MSAFLAGTASAIFLAAMDLATAFRETHPVMIIGLPAAGLVMGMIYHRFGRPVEGGTRLVLEEIHAEADATHRPIPLRMAPLILCGTVVTHLFGGSAGREGTALQLGASLADQWCGPLRLTPARRRVLLMAGLSAGFGSVFGTPLAGAAFGLEVAAFPRFRWSAVLPCLFAAYAADLVTRSWGIRHTAYIVPNVTVLPLDWASLTSAVVIGVVGGLVAFVFVQLTHGVDHVFKRAVSYPPFRPMIGGLLILVLVATFALGGLGTGVGRYFGLGIPTIIQAFAHPGPGGDFVGKLLFTAVTLGAGFKGGEVTPLFFIGATLGNALSAVLPLGFSALAAVGFVTVFAGAAKTPIASTFMAYELFGPRLAFLAGLACLVAQFCSGKQGLYRIVDIDR